jgi:hypothetical protein
MKKPAAIIIGLMAFMFPALSQDFYAYHTKIHSGESFEVHSRTDGYADLVVQMEEGALIFHRKTSFLPYWETATGVWTMEEVVPRSGDGSDRMPDKFNTYSQVKIIENNRARIIINWRYVPDFNLISEKGWVDEEFTIYPDGSVTRVIRDQSQNLEDWENPDQWTVKRYDLALDGIREAVNREEGEIQLSGASSEYYQQEAFDHLRETWVFHAKRPGAPGHLSLSASKPDQLKLIIIGWGRVPLHEIRVDSESFQNYKAGIIRTLEGTDMILFLDIKQEKTAKVEIIPGKSESQWETSETESEVMETESQAIDKEFVIAGKKKGVYGNPIAWWDFDTGGEHRVVEKVTGKTTGIKGYSKRVEGVNGQGIQFSEFQNYVTYSSGEAPSVNPEEFSVEAWIAPRSSPWYKIPIAMQRDPDAGYYFGLDGDNKLFLEVFVNGSWQHCATSPPYPGLELEDGMERYMINKAPEIVIPMLEWTHVAGTFSSREGIKLYVNGVLRAEDTCKGRMLVAEASDFYIGMETEEHYPAHTERPGRGTDKSLYSFDGLMDELKIHNNALSAEEVNEAYQFNHPVIRKPLSWRQAPRGPDGSRPFGAYQTTLKFNDQNYDRCWRPGNQADVVVYFDEFDYKMVWWHGVAYYPIYYSENGIGLTHEVCETRTRFGCAEALMDKECRYTRVQVLENTDARVVVKYRSAASDRRYFIAHEDEEHDGWGCWTDEILTIYPDGSMPRQVTMWCSVQDEWHEFEQENYFFNPGQTPWNVVEKERNTIANMNGEVSQLEWVNNRPEGKFINDAVIKTYNYRDSGSRPYAIVQKGLSVIYESQETLGDTPLEGAGWWDHWPVSQIPSDGKNPIFPNGHFSSSSSGAIFTTNHIGSPADLEHPSIIKAENKLVIPFLFGMTTENAGALVPLAKMYNHPPDVTEVKGAVFDRYNVFKHEYIFSEPDGPISFTVNASSQSPISNICFAIKNWDRDQKASITLNGKGIEPGMKNRQGIIRDTDGSRTLIIWVKHNSTEPAIFYIEPLGETIIKTGILTNINFK